MTKRQAISTEPYKGVRDFYPEDQAALSHISKVMRKVTEHFGYVEYHASVLEPAELYKAKGAENEEIVNDQTYTFTDRGGREVTLRPEMTPTVARMVAAKRRELGYPLRWYSIPNLFRYERSQRGRLREHWQLNVDIFGAKSLAADAEVIAVAYHILTGLGASGGDFIIKIGSRKYLDNLITTHNLSVEQAKVLRGLLDRRGKIPQDEFEAGVQALGVPPTALIPTEAPEDVATVLSLLREMQIENAVFDPSIVRGFDYYTGVVFEVFDTNPQNARSIMGGGRYDNLTQLFDDESVTGVGFGLGDVTLQDFLVVRNLIPAYVPPTQVYIALASQELLRDAIQLADEMHRENIAVALDFGEKKLGDQIKVATKHNIPYLIVVGEDEIKSGVFKLKNLDSGEEVMLKRDLQIGEFFRNLTTPQ
jgi:histidyl-tRNA synthetase